MSTQRSFAQQERVVKQNQLLKLIKIIYNDKMKLYCVSLHFNHFFKSSDVLNFVKNIMGITAVLFALASLFSIVNNDGYFFKVFVKIGKVPYEGLMSLLTCHTQKNEHHNISEINDHSLQDNVASWIQKKLP